MDDLISRQDAIDDLHSKSQLQIWDTEDVEVWINDLPSASTDLSTFSDKLWKIAYERGKEEARKKGKWILDPDGMDWNLPAWRCSLCGCRNNNIGVVAKGEGLGQNPLMWAGSKYCPHCGADMTGGEEK